jgi:O-antigen/teichoic acid export membrane protein
MPNTKDLTNKTILIFWLPLAATWLLMSVEGPFLASIIARMAEPKFNLAAYGVAFSFALIVEAPVIMLMSAATALAKDYNSFKKLRNFTYSLNGIITLFMLVLLIPAIFDFIAIDLIALPIEVEKITYWAFVALLPWPSAIGYRRFYQGILIRNNLTRFVTFGTAIRLTTMLSATFLLYFSFKLNGAIVASIALSIGVVFEAIASKLFANKTLAQIEQTKSDDLSNNLTYKEIFIFYYPLALTSIISLGIHPIVTFLIGQSRMSVESLAVLPVINGLVFIFRAVGLSFHEAFLALLGENGEGYKSLKKFGFIAASLSIIILLSITTTPLAYIWFQKVAGLSQELTQLSILPAIVLSLIPPLTFLISIQRAVLIYSRKTSSLTIATIIEVSVILIVLFVGIKYFDFVGVLAATIAYITGRAFANIYLIFPSKKAIQKFDK